MALFYLEFTKICCLCLLIGLIGNCGLALVIGNEVRINIGSLLMPQR